VDRVIDLAALFADERGQSLLSRTAVSEITERLWAEYEAFAGAICLRLAAKELTGLPLRAPGEPGRPPQLSWTSSGGKPIRRW
jgi:DsbC/DsbD-like thiol-disulfide interchange protein